MRKTIGGKRVMKGAKAKARKNTVEGFFFKKKETTALGTNLLISSTVYLFRASPRTRVARQSPCKLPVSIQPYKLPQAVGKAVPI